MGQKKRAKTALLITDAGDQSYFISPEAGSAIELRCLFSWMWSHTKWSCSQVACRSASSGSEDAGLWPIANRSPHWPHTTSFMTRVFAGGAFALTWRKRFAVPLDAAWPV
jgi:hypothetical protein